jgi:hypothetical protein
MTWQGNSAAFSILIREAMNHVAQLKTVEQMRKIKMKKLPKIAKLEHSSTASSIYPAPYLSCYVLSLQYGDEVLDFKRWLKSYNVLLNFGNLSFQKCFKQRRRAENPEMCT